LKKDGKNTSCTCLLLICNLLGKFYNLITLLLKMSSVYSWELFDRFYSATKDENLRLGFRLVEICFNNYPHEPDSIPLIILESIEEECREIKHKLFIKTLLEYYHWLLTN